MIKKTLLLTIYLIFSLSQGTTAQTAKVPPFRILQADGKVFMAEKLPVGKPIIIVYFSPECEECHKLTEDLLDRMIDLKSVSIAMITYQSVENVRKYAVEYNLNRYNNIFIGTEGSTLFVKNFYGITKFPFIALHDKNGDLIKKYTISEINIDDLLLRIKRLK